MLLYTQVLVPSDTALELQIGVLWIGRLASPLDCCKIAWPTFSCDGSLLDSSGTHM